MTDQATHAWTGEVAAQRDGFTLLPEVEELRDAGETRRVATPFGHEATMVSRYADVRELHGDPERFRLDGVPAPPALVAAGRDTAEFRRRQAGNLLGQEPPDHTRLRRMLTGEFTVKRMKRLVPRVEEIVTEHLDAMEKAGPPAELVADFALPVPSMVICELLGVPYEDRGEFTERSARQLDSTIEPQERMRLADASREYMSDLVSRHREAPGDDLLGMLIREHSDDVTDDELHRHRQPAARRRARDDVEHAVAGHARAARAPRPAGPGPRRPLGGRRRGRGAAAPADRGARELPARRRRGHDARRAPGGGRRAGGRVAGRGQPRPGGRRARRGARHLPLRRPRTSPSATASTTAWAPRWRGSRCAWRSRPCCSASRGCAWPASPSSATAP